MDFFPNKMSTILSWIHSVMFGNKRDESSELFELKTSIEKGLDDFAQAVKENRLESNRNRTWSTGSGSGENVLSITSLFLKFYISYDKKQDAYEFEICNLANKYTTVFKVIYHRSVFKKEFGDQLYACLFNLFNSLLHCTSSYILYDFYNSTALPSILYPIDKNTNKNKKFKESFDTINETFRHYYQ